MRIDIISAAPDLLESPFNHSIVKRARSGKNCDSRFKNLWSGKLQTN